MRKLGWIQTLLGALFLVAQFVYWIHFFTGADDETDLVERGGRARATVTEVRRETRQDPSDDHHDHDTVTLVSYRFEGQGRTTDVHGVEIGTLCGNVRAGMELPVFYDLGNPQRNLLECKRPAGPPVEIMWVLPIALFLIGGAVVVKGLVKTRAHRMMTHGVEAVTVERDGRHEYDVAGKSYRATETGDAKDATMRLPDGTWLVLYDPRRPAVHVVVTNGMFEELHTRAS